MSSMIAANGMQASYTEAVLPDATMRTPHSAFEGAYIERIDVYEVILSDTIPREDIGRMAGERIIDNGVSPWVGAKYMVFTPL